jgi:hypothetical protein
MSGYQEYECVLKSNTGVIAPTIELNLGLVVNPSAYNFAYIPDFGRYYWVQEWDFVQSTWIASLSVDVLATWRPYIGDTDMYVYRSSYEYDGNIPDSMYNSTADVTHSVSAIPSINKKLTDGYYIISVYGNGNESNKTVSFFCFDSPNFAKFINRVYSYINVDSFWNIVGSTIQTIGTGIRNAFYNISDYIGGCMWSPLNPGDAQESVKYLYLGNYAMDLQNGIDDIACFRIRDNVEGVVYNFANSVLIPKHPQASTRGKCYNMAPYTKYKLVYLPFGVMDLDTVRLADFTYLKLDVRVDGITGQGILKIYGFNGTQANPTDVTLLFVRTCKYLVDIPVVYTKTNLYGIMQNQQYEAINRSYVNKNATASLTALHAIQSAYDLLNPEIDVTGKIGGMAEVDFTSNGLYAIFLGVADEDNDSNGRPLCKIRKPVNIPGYIEGESNSFSAPATESEMAEVKRFIESGFYYE